MADAPANPQTGDEPQAGWWERRKARKRAKAERAAQRSVLGKLWHDWVFPIGLVIVVLTSARSSLLDWNDVPSGSMMPSILVGDRIVVNKLAYDLRVPFTRVQLAEWGQPQRGDIVTFWSPEPPGTRLVKRVVATGGDVVRMVDGRLLIRPAGEDGWQPADYGVPRGVAGADREDVLGHRRAVQYVEGDRRGLVTQGVDLRAFGPIEVPEDMVWVMGDNRDRSRDSRFFGLVPHENITGRAFAVAGSLGKGWRPRWDRFFMTLE